MPFTIVHPSYEGNKRCKAVTSHVDIAMTLISFAGGDPKSITDLPGRDVSVLLDDPESASTSALRDAALYNFNMFSFVDRDFIGSVGKFLAAGGAPADLPKQGYKPNMKKRGAIRSIYDGQYKFSRYFSPLDHHTPKTVEQLFANNDVELYDLRNDPLEIKNLALDIGKYGEVIAMMNIKMNRLIEEEVGEDNGQMLPSINGSSWTLSTSIDDFRP